MTETALVNEPDTPARTAVIVVAGVGDEAPDAAAADTVRGLVRYAGASGAKVDGEWYPIPGADPQFTPRHTVTLGDGTPVDVYEFWWADLSRFPAALRSFTVALFGLLLQFTSIGRAGLRRGVAVPSGHMLSGRHDSASHRASGLLGAIEWLVAVPLLLLNVVQFALIAAIGLDLAILRRLGDSKVELVPRLATSAALALFAVTLAVGGLKAVRRYQDVFGRRWAVPVAAAFAVAALVIGTWRGIARKEAALGLADTLVASVAYPFRVLWMLVGLTVLAFLVALVPVLRRSDVDRRQAQTALLGLTIGPLGFALFSAMISTTLGSVVQNLGGGPNWQRGRGPWCLSGPGDWLPGSGDCATLKFQSAWEWGRELLGQSLAPLTIIGPIALLIAFLAVPGAMRLAFSRRRSPGVQANAVERLLGGIDGALARGALIIGLGISGVALLLTYTPLTKVVYRQLIGATRVGAAVLGGLVLLVFAGVRFIGLTPKGLKGRGTASEGVRAVLDRAYDVGTWLREPGYIWRGRPRDEASIRMPRQDVLARGRALAAHVTSHRTNAGAQYERVVFFSHSQGTVITTALLAEPDVSLPPSVSLVTFGSPLRRLDARRLPTQYSWLTEGAAAIAAGVPSVNAEWASFAASRDPIGGPVFHEPTSAEWDALSSWSATERIALTEGLITGGHSAYWRSEPVLAKLASLCAPPTG